MEKFKLRWKDQLAEANEFIENGDPLKDVMDDSEIGEMICELHEALKGVAA